MIWNAIQPALQLVSKLLRAEHPTMLAWLDLRKLRPVTDDRDTIEDPRGNDLKDPEAVNEGIARAYYFSVWPEFSGLEADLGPLTRSWADMRELCRSGFDTSQYAFDILRATIQWEFQGYWRTGNPGTKTGSRKTSGSTFTIVSNKAPGNGPPFNIVIEISSDMLWPLLVDEYSATEKAAASFLLANTMLHELSVSKLVVALLKRG